LTEGVSVTALVWATVGTLVVALATAFGSSIFVFIKIGKRVYKLKLSTDTRFENIANYIVNMKRMYVTYCEPHFSIHDEIETPQV
jgi:hypothetical protein